MEETLLRSESLHLLIDNSRTIAVFGTLESESAAAANCANQLVAIRKCSDQDHQLPSICGFADRFKEKDRERSSSDIFNQYLQNCDDELPKPNRPSARIAIYCNLETHLPANTVLCRHSQLRNVTLDHHANQTGAWSSATDLYSKSN
jgi:hypothetical protein